MENFMFRTIKLSLRSLFPCTACHSVFVCMCVGCWYNKRMDSQCDTTTQHKKAISNARECEEAASHACERKQDYENVRPNDGTHHLDARVWVNANSLVPCVLCSRVACDDSIVNIPTPRKWADSANWIYQINIWHRLIPFLCRQQMAAINSNHQHMPSI